MKLGKIEISSVAGSHHFIEFEFAILMVLLIQKISFLQDVLNDVQYTMHFKFIEAINSKGIHVGIEIKTGEHRNKFSSWVTPFLLNMNLLF